MLFDVGSEISINGNQPSIVGSICSEFIAIPFMTDEGLEEKVNQAYLCCEGVWHRIYFDYNIVFWRTDGRPNIEGNSINLLKKISNNRLKLVMISYKSNEGFNNINRKVFVDFTFANNKIIRLIADGKKDKADFEIR